MQVRRLLLLILVLVPGCGTPAVPPATPNAGPPGTIPLESVYTTSGQEGLKPLDWDATLGKMGAKKWSSDHGPDPIRVYDSSGASNVFLVFGRDIDEAMQAAVYVLARSCPADFPVDPEGIHMPWQRNTAKPLSPCWLVAYFGKSSGSPTTVRVESVEAEGKTVRITYSKAEPAATVASNDVRTHVVFAPLRQLGKGTYWVELYDSGTRRASLTRAVEVK